MSRFDTFHQLTYQTRLLGALNVTPLAGVRETWYSLGANTTGRQNVLRNVFTTGVDVTTKFFRVYDIQSNAADLDLHFLRHVITPSLSYRYTGVANVPPSELKQFDGLDGLDESNVLTPSLEQKLQTKRGAGGQMQSVDLARWVSSTTYTFASKTNPVGGRLGDFNESFELRPYSWMLTQLGTAFSTHPHRRFQNLNIDFSAGPNLAYQTTSDVGTVQGFDRRSQSDAELPWAVGAGWRWVRDGNTQAECEFIANLGKKWRIGLYERADIRRLVSDGSKFVNRPAESEVRIRRDLHEWTVELIINRRRADGNFILLVFRLKAFPDQPLEFERGYNRPKLGDRRPLFAG